jgi:Peptidase M16C associated
MRAGLRCLLRLTREALPARCLGLQERLASGEDLFGPLIRRFLLDNTHRVTVELLPDKSLGAKIEAQEKARLEAKKASLEAPEIEAVIRETQELKERQVRVCGPGFQSPGFGCIWWWRAGADSKF